MLQRIESNEEKKEIPVYYAPNPYTSLTGIRFLDAMLYSIASIPNRYLGKQSSQLVLPAQSRAPVALRNETLAQLELKYAYKITKSIVMTYDGAELDTIEIKQCKKDSLYIIKFNGNGTLYEDVLEYFLDDAYRLKANVIGFNYRGVGNSIGSPKSITHLVTDGIAIVQRILDRGVLPKFIILDGLSLGGGIATLVAKHFHDQGSKVNLFNDRSFSSISSAATHMLKHMIFKEITPMKEFLMETTSYCSVRTVNWQINAARAYESIPAANKAYMFVTDEAKFAGNMGDGVIPQKSSLHDALKNSKGRGDKFYMMTSKMFPGHNASRKHLQSAMVEGLNGENVFDSFVKSVVR